MNEYLEILKKIKLFDGLNESELLSALGCLDAKIKKFKKGELIFCEGNNANYVGILLLGEAQLQKTDYEGNINIISKIYPPGLVAGAAAFSFEKKLPFDALAVCETTILFIDSERLIRTCSKQCVHHARLIENMLSILSQKNIEFSHKIDILTKRTIREKIMTYLFTQSKRSKNNSFTIGLSRRQMAEYLSINRSALSRELSKMRDEGILDFDGNRFSIR